MYTIRTPYVQDTYTIGTPYVHHINKLASRLTRATLKTGKAARSYERAAPTRTNHYETRTGALLSVAEPMQYLKHCHSLDAATARFIHMRTLLSDCRRIGVW